MINTNLYNKIYDFCKVKNLGGCKFNEIGVKTPRMEWITKFLDEVGLDWNIDTFVVHTRTSTIVAHNIIIPSAKKPRGKQRILIAHHDIVNPNIDNANDNSCSVINAIITKLHMPELTVVLTDCEEIGGIGADRLGSQINNGKFGDVLFVLNLELTGRGGKNFFVGNYPGKLRSSIVRKFKCQTVRTPFNDSVMLRKHGIDSTVINPLPKKKDGTLDFSMLYNCHTNRDSVETINPKDMKIFVEEVILPILKEPRK
jgi:hypothetical protein